MNRLHQEMLANYEAEYIQAFADLVIACKSWAKSKQGERGHAAKFDAVDAHSMRVHRIEQDWAKIGIAFEEIPPLLPNEEVLRRAAVGWDRLREPKVLCSLSHEELTSRAIGAMKELFERAIPLIADV